jgi:EAL domain-containing protein (putative c-di-GMP-specific phosphodiesterase class I)
VDGEGSSQAADLKSGRPRPALADADTRARGRWIGPAFGVVAILSVAAMAVTFTAAVAAYGFAERSDRQQWAEQREALRNAVGEFRQLFAGDAVDPRFVRMVEQSARLQGLKFETDPAPGEREMQPVVDAKGRIAGFFTWDQAHPMRAAMHGLMPLIALFAVALMSLAGFAVRCLVPAQRDGVAVETLAADASREDASPSIAAVVINSATDVVDNDRAFIERELPRALSANELDLHYQPIVAAQGARIVGVEALLRWTHLERGAIGPAVFIPIAEQMGLMDALGTFVLRRALADAKRWPNLYLAVNLSPLQVRDRAVVDTVRSALEESGVAPSRLMLEITEGVLIDNRDEMVKRIDDLHELGVRIALDDFGSGYSNLGYLQRFPIDKLKIDRSFVTPLGQSSSGGVIIQAIVALGRALGLSVLAEGVETERQRVLLRLAGCDEMQGFLFAKPAPAKAIDKLVRQGQNVRPAEALTA